MQRNDVASILVERCINVKCLLGFVISFAVLFFQMFTVPINVTVRDGSDLYNIYTVLLFREFVLEKKNHYENTPIQIY